MRNDGGVLVKICGITTPEDAQAVSVAGADAIGLNFVGGPRRIDVDTDQAKTILQAISPPCTPIALVDVGSGELPAPLPELFGRFRVSHLQLYGHVTNRTLKRLLDDGFKPIIVHPVVPDRFPNDVSAALSSFGRFQPVAILLDAYHETLKGGTGITTDWSAIASARNAGTLTSWPPLILAGGLTPDNVAEAVATVRPWAVDVSSGVEQSPGIKDHERVATFIARVREADNE